MTPYWAKTSTSSLKRMTTEQVSGLILAAGKGTRMKSAIAKVLHEVFYAPMLHHVLDAMAPLRLERTIVIIGHQHEQVEAALRGYPVTPVVQREQLGTGHAVLCAEESLRGAGGVLLILCGDTPLIRTATLAAMLASHQEQAMPLTVMTTALVEPAGYGRIIRNSQGEFEKIVEEKDASSAERRITEINAGIYCVDLPFIFNALARVGTDNNQGERYLTDIVAIARGEGRQVNMFCCADSMEVLGVNSRLELAEAHRQLQLRRNAELMLAGVTLLAPDTISVQPGVTIGPDTCIHPNVHLTGSTRVGRHCIIAPNTVLHDCRIGDNVTIGPLSLLNGQELADNTCFPPQP